MTPFLPILLYHRIDHSALSTATPPATFRRHLEWLHERGWRSLTLQEFEFYHRSGDGFPAKSFLISFDDGYSCLAGIVHDTLKEFRYTAIGFLPTRLLCDAEAGKLKKGEFLTWAQARALQSSGVFDFHSHTHSHKRFRECTAEAIREDLGISVEILARELGMPRKVFTHLAWPWGDSQSHWRSAARECGFRYQYTVARRSFRHGFPHDDIPRTCFDAAAFGRFQWQLALQSGPLSPVWHAAYPVGRRLRKFASLSSDGSGPL